MSQTKSTKCPHDGTSVSQASSDNNLWRVHCKHCGAGTRWTESLDEAEKLWEKTNSIASELNCPKCGDASVGMKNILDSQGHKGYAVVCSGCGWNGPISSDSIEPSPWKLWTTRQGAKNAN